MDRRSFLHSFGGGLIATATLAEAGILAEFYDWIRRAPAWSLPPQRAPLTPLMEELTAMDLVDFRKHMIFDNFFVGSPMTLALRGDQGVLEAA